VLLQIQQTKHRRNRVSEYSKFVKGKEHRNVRCVQHTTADRDSASYRSHLSVASRLPTLLLRRNEEDITRKEDL